jgi:MFS family permease
MVYGLLPVFLVNVLGASIGFVGVMEGAAEAANSAMRLLSGAVSDRVGRRKPVVAFGYLLSAFNKLLFPVAESVFVVLVARVVDRFGKGIRDAPRDAFIADLTPTQIRGSGFGLRAAFYTIGFVLGPLAAIGLMALSGDDFRLVFWFAILPAFGALGILLFAVTETSGRRSGNHALRINLRDLSRLASPFWWAISIASLLSLARFSPAFLVLKASDIGIDAAFVPLILVFTHTVYSAAAYPFGVLADRLDRRLQLGLATAVLITADIVLGTASSFLLTMLGAALWGLQMGMTDGLLAAAVADAAPEDLRGTAFGIYQLAFGIAAFVASGAAGALWSVGGPKLVFGISACVAAGVVPTLFLESQKNRHRPKL